MASVGLLVPSVFPDAPPERKELDSFISQAEELGFDSLWVLERLFHERFVLDAYTLLTWAAARTSSIGLGTSVLLLLLRNPTLLAKQIRTLDQLSGGRVELGVSLGGTESELQTIGVTKKQRPKRFEEAVTILSALLNEGKSEFKGRYYQAMGAVAPRETNGRSVPLWFGAVSEPGMRRAAHLADGWMPDGFLTGTCDTADDFIRLKTQMEEYLEQEDRRASQFQYAKLFYWIWLGADEDECRRRVASVTEAYYGRTFPPDRYLAGPPDKILKRLEPFAKAGMHRIILGPAALDTDQVELIARELMPALNSIGKEE